MAPKGDQVTDDTTISVRHQVVDKLRQEIVSGRFPPGGHLSDRALCEHFKVSRTVVREAVRQLEAEGLVESFANRGSFVKIVSLDEAVQIFDVRALLEAWSARKFVQYATDEQIQELIDELEDLKKGILQRRKIDLVARKQKYYDMLLAVYENTYIQTMLNQIQSWSGQLRAAAMAAHDRIPHTIEELDRLIGAIGQRDEEEVWAASLDHVRKSEAAALSVMHGRKASKFNGKSPNVKESGPFLRQERYDAGLKERQESLGRQYVDAVLEESDELSRPTQDFITEIYWGDVWNREGLDRKTRSLLNLAMLTALNRPHEMEVHLRGAINNGVSKKELSELFLQAAIFCGVPAAVEGLRLARKAFDEPG